MVTAILWLFRFFLAWTAFSVLFTVGLCAWLAAMRKERRRPGQESSGRPGDME